MCPSSFQWDSTTRCRQSMGMRVHQRLSVYLDDIWLVSKPDRVVDLHNSAERGCGTGEGSGSIPGRHMSGTDPAGSPQFAMSCRGELKCWMKKGSCVDRVRDSFHPTGHQGVGVPSGSRGFCAYRCRVLFQRRLALPLPLSNRTCRCGRPLDVFGHHRAACARCGVLGRRGFVLDSAVGRVCREAGAMVATNQFVRDLDLGVPNANDNRRLEVVATVCHCLAGSNSPWTQPSSLYWKWAAVGPQRLGRSSRWWRKHA